MKHIISVSALMLSMAACSSDPTTGGGTSGSGSTSAGASATGGRASGSGGSGAAGGPTGSGGAGTVAGSSGNTAGAAPTAGSPGTAGTGAGGTGAGGTGAGGTSAGGTSAGGTVATGGSGPAATFKCDNLSLAPSKTGVAQPAGAVGGLKVIDWAGFTGAASFTFDDNTPSQIPNYNALKATGAHFTWFLIASSASAASYKPTIADGQEIANHTQTHPQSASQGEVTNGENTLKSNFGVDVHSMAAPNCADAWAAFAAPAKLFQNRGPCGNGIATVGPRDSTDPFKLPAYLPAAGEAGATMSASITAGKWRIFVIHGFDSQNGTYQPVPIANVTSAMSKAVTDGFWAEGITNVGAYWQGQKLIPATATTSATWTLPANFPPNMCVRITTTGGTVTQKNETISWDSHGYYQISLDAGEVTIK
ncbi:MAG: polysaccharide deacetylase family protein [Pseudomonadota bacterium]